MLTLMRKQGDSALVERYDGVAAQPLALVGDQAISKIPSCLEHRQSSIHSRTINGDVFRTEQRFNGVGNVLLLKLVNAAPNPNKLTQARKRSCDELCFFQNFGGHLGLLFIVGDYGSDKDVRIGSDSHFCLDQPADAASFISSSVATFLVLPASRPRKSSIFPSGRAALSTTAPSGCLSNSIFSPGRIPRCWSTSLRKVTWPRAVTVKVVIRLSSLLMSNGNAKTHYLQ